MRTLVHVRGHSDDNGNDRADTLVQWGNGAAPYARGREGAGEGESRLKGDGTEGAKAIEDQKKAKVKEKEKKNAEGDTCTTHSRGGLRQQPARPVFRSETEAQPGTASTTVIATANSVVIQFE